MQIHRVGSNCLLIAFMFFSAIASGDEIDDGIDAFDNGDYATAYEILLPLAEHHGYTKAMNTLGLMFEQGLGVEKQGSEAEKWYKKAALQGNSEAMYNLGLLYSEGNLVPKDTVKGMAWMGAAFDHRQDEAARVAKLLSVEMSDGELNEASKLRRRINSEMYGSKPQPVISEPALTEPPVDPSRLLTSEQIIDAYSGITVMFEFRDSIALQGYRSHSSKRSAMLGKKAKISGQYRDGFYNGKWWTVNNKLCVEYSKVKVFDDCFWIEATGESEYTLYSQKTGDIIIETITGFQ
ncbi:MAG: tetratricopeptide repeat protein [Arenicellales bacterium]